MTIEGRRVGRHETAAARSSGVHARLPVWRYASDLAPGALGLGAVDVSICVHHLSQHASPSGGGKRLTGVALEIQPKHSARIETAGVGLSLWAYRERFIVIDPLDVSDLP